MALAQALRSTLGAFPGVLHLAVGQGESGPLAPDPVHEPVTFAPGLEVVQAQRVAELVGQGVRIRRVVDDRLPFLQPDAQKLVGQHRPLEALLDLLPVAVAGTK